ncbi:MAG: DNA-3-methyladenine glycosylase [Candidatus Omnitrophica bacterium]|nr:DNA-3-methyladenine glycosylase [Candidatus Omnitrophota bacterium]
MKILDRAFFGRNTQIVAAELIGKILVLNQGGSLVSGKIVETEAYFGADDPASHAFRGVTPRNRVMFGPAGVSYVYFTYGNHHCLNIVTEADGVAGAVLLRALEPLSGLSIMKKRRGAKHQTTALANGPGKLTQAFGITRDHSEIDMTRGPFFVAEKAEEGFVHVQTAKRIGISAAQHLPYRFYLRGNPFVSVQ